MQYFWTFFWTFLLVQMLNYVAGSMLGVPFDFATGSILGVVATIIILVVPSILPNEPAEKHLH
ncbi:YjzD family protein [Bacillus sp. REN3]|uniref:YjzD family protein n=1 Tax=Bacillus sp. REN3 TaxID=2802440 RepID=UPI001AEE829D|nr:YjzD family protein [Bacillus sp. REN3]